MELFTFKAVNKYFGIEAQFVHRVLEGVDVAAVPLMPACHAGLIYYRGELFDVVDLGTLLKKQKTGTGSSIAVPSKRRRIRKTGQTVLVKWDHRKLGLIPDKIVGMIWIDTDRIAETVHTAEGETVRIISPDDIWEALSQFSYEPR